MGGSGISTRWSRPSSALGALSALVQGGTALGGGTALMSAAFPHTIGETVVDLAGAGLDDLAPPLIGALVTLEALAANPDIEAGWPAVAQAARATAGPEVRRLATVGGMVASRIVTADLPTALCAYETTVHVATVDGVTVEPLADELRQPPDGRLVLAIELGPRAPGAYRRLAGRAGPAPAIAAVAGTVTPEGLVLWAGAVADGPLPFAGHEPPPIELLRDDERASAWYRRRVLKVLADEVREALEP